MPNYKLSPRFHTFITNTADYLLKRRVEHAQLGFPVPYDKLQAAILPEKWRAAIMEMRAEGVQVSTAVFVRCNIAHVEVPRTASVQFGVSPKQLSFCARMPQFDMNVLSLDEQAELVKWVNNLVQEKRLANLAGRTIKSFLGLPTIVSSAHVIARWPGLTMLVGGPTQYPLYGRDAVIWRDWKVKFSNPPRSLKPYGWSAHDREHGWLGKHKKAMQLTEMLLTSASMLPDAKNGGEEIKALLQTWTPAPGDADKP